MKARRRNPDDNPDILKAEMRFRTDNLWSFVLLIALAAIAACDQDEPCPTCPPRGQHTLSLDTAYTDVTEIALKLQIADSCTQRHVQLVRNGVIVLTDTLAGNDTIIVDAPLTPKSPYSYRAYRLQNGVRIDSSDQVAVQTMDTTSHNFIWEIDTVGDGANSFLQDVAIVNDTCVFAVGEIHNRDSSGNWDPTPYSIAKWNGSRWQLMKLFYDSIIVISPIRGIWITSQTDFWFAAGSVFHWDGSSRQAQLVFSRLSLPDPNATIEKLWGTASTDLYGVGNSGTIVHFDGSTWQKMESGTDVDLMDVWGSPDGSVVWACGYYRSKIGTLLLRYKGSKWEVAYDGGATEFEILYDTLSGAFTGVFAVNNFRVYVGSSAGIYISPVSTQGEARRVSFTPDYFPGFPNALRGTGSNDFFIVGDYNFMAHFNGFTLENEDQFWDQNSGLWSVDVQHDLVVAVGYSYDPINSKGIVIRGER